MGLAIEREKLSEQLMQDPDVTYALAGLKSLGVMSTDQALNRWEIIVIPKRDWPGDSGTSVIHLFPWGEEVGTERTDKAWFLVSFGHDGTRRIWCKRDAKEGSDHITLSSEGVPVGAYPQKWSSLSFYDQGRSASLRFDPNYVITSVEGHDEAGSFNAYKDREGTVGIEDALVKVGRSLGLSPQEMPGRTTFNPGILVNTILDQTQPFNVSQMIASARAQNS